jgi:hypothetical protein
MYCRTSLLHCQQVKFISPHHSCKLPQADKHKTARGIKFWDRVSRFILAWKKMLQVKLQG